MGKKKEWERKFEEYDLNAEPKQIDEVTEKLKNGYIFMKGIHILLLQGVLQFYYIGMRMQM